MTEQIKTVIAQQLDMSPDSIENDKDIMDYYGADSLDAVDILLALEEAFGMTVPDEEAIELRTVQDIINYIEENK